MLQRAAGEGLAGRRRGGAQPDQRRRGGARHDQRRDPEQHRHHGLLADARRSGHRSPQCTVREHAAEADPSLGPAGRRGDH